MNQIISHNFRNSVLRLTVLFWITFKLMSINLWWSWQRTFPELPLKEYLSNIPSRASDGLAILSLSLLIVALINPKRIILILIFGLEIFLMSLDQMRWQPTIFQFMVTIAIGFSQPKHFKFYLLFLLSVTYIFSGLHKLNLGFVNFLWGKFILIDFLGIAPEIAFHRGVKAIGLALPLIEIIAGLFLWTRYRKIGWLLLIVMHLLLLLTLGPLGTNFNSIIWPWNVLMIVFAILYLKDESLTFRLNYFKNLTGVVLILVLVILPISSFFGKHSPLLSFIYTVVIQIIYMYIQVAWKLKRMHLNQWILKIKPTEMFSIGL